MFVKLPVHVSVYLPGYGSENYSDRDARWDNRLDYGAAQ